VVGLATTPAQEARAIRWANGVWQNLGTLGGNRSFAYSVSSDGSVVVGVSRDATQRVRSFRWASGVMQDLGALPGYDQSYAWSVSADGSVVVGWASNADGQYRAIRWANGVWQDLGVLGNGDHSEAWGVSSDGSIVVGLAYIAPGQSCAFRWTPDGGMENLNQTYASVLTDGSALVTASAISPDGRYIVGWGINAATGRREAYLLDTGARCTPHSGDVDSNGCVDDADLLAVLFAFGNAGSNLGRVDVNCDQTVDDADLLAVLFNFGSGC
jgi:probable HAF family extracellular repeat protein